MTVDELYDRLGIIRMHGYGNCEVFFDLETSEEFNLLCEYMIDPIVKSLEGIHTVESKIIPSVGGNGRRKAILKGVG